jgi:hypothetical protein
LLVLLLLVGATLALIMGAVAIVAWLSAGGSGAAIALGVLLSAPLWRAFLRYYKYEAHSLKPITKKDDPE